MLPADSTSPRSNKRKQIFAVKSAELSFEETSLNDNDGRFHSNINTENNNNNNKCYDYINNVTSPNVVEDDAVYSRSRKIDDEEGMNREKPTQSLQPHSVSLFNTMKDELADFVGGLLRERESPINLVEAPNTYDADSYDYSDSLYSSYSSASTYTQDQPMGYYQPVHPAVNTDSVDSKLTQDEHYYDNAVVHVVVPVSSAEGKLLPDYEDSQKVVFHQTRIMSDHRENEDYQPITEKIRALSPFPPGSHSQSEGMVMHENISPAEENSPNGNEKQKPNKRKSQRINQKPLDAVTDNTIKDETPNGMYCKYEIATEDHEEVYMAKKARHPCKNDEHNAKERVRRARIKNSADVLKELIPGCTMKTDKASVFEQAVNYVIFMQGKVSPKMKDKVHQEFVTKYVASGTLDDEDSS